MDRYEHALVEWIWDGGTLRTVMPSGEERTSQGMYSEVVSALRVLGSQGFHVVGCTGYGNWIMWTLERPLTSE
jgi:hypothetical protein